MLRAIIKNEMRLLAQPKFKDQEVGSLLCLIDINITNCLSHEIKSNIYVCVL